MDAVAPGSADMSDVVTDAEIVLALAETADLTARDVPALPEDVHRGATRRRIDRFVDWVRRHGLEAAFADPEHTARLYLVSRNVVDAWLRYRPGAFPGQVHVFRAERRPAGGDWALGWRQYATSVVVHEVAGDHQSMFTEAEVASLAARLRSVLEPVSAVESVRGSR
jgi:thioesterase domain-containing protein